MYIVDLDCACNLCGYEQFQRFYHDVPFHSLTLPDLEDLADRAPLKAGYECENCGQPVGANEVRHATLTYGFADDAGIIRIFDDLLDRTRSYELTSRRRLDPQAVPRWAPDRDAHHSGHHVTDEIDELIVESLLDRPFNIKLAWRDLLEDWIDDPEGGAFSRVSPGLWIVIDEDEDAADLLVDEIDDDDFWEAYDDGDLAVISLHDCLPHDLITHGRPELMAGRWTTWLSDEVVDAIESDRLWADAYLSRSAAIDVIARTLDVGRLQYREEQTDADLFFANITTPTDTTYPRGLSVTSVLRRAVYTGLTPGESARLTAEEIVGFLLGVWNSPG